MGTCLQQGGCRAAAWLDPEERRSVQLLRRGRRCGQKGSEVRRVSGYRGDRRGGVGTGGAERGQEGRRNDVSQDKHGHACAVQAAAAKRICSEIENGRPQGGRSGVVGYGRKGRALLEAEENANACCGCFARNCQCVLTHRENQGHALRSMVPFELELSDRVPVRRLRAAISPAFKRKEAR